MSSKTERIARARQSVLNKLDELRETGKPVSCRTLAQMLGLETKTVTSCLRALTGAKCVKKNGSEWIKNARGKQIEIALYESTGVPYCAPAKASHKASEMGEELPEEPDGEEVIRIPLGPNHTRIRFGKYAKTGRGQTSRSTPQGFCSMERI